MSIVEDDLSREEDIYEFIQLYTVHRLDWDSMLVQQSMLNGPMLVQQLVLSGPMLVQHSKRSVVGDAWIGESLYDKL
jgi:hypothetical protein